MVKRQITQIKKDLSGNITTLCNPSEWWSPKLSSVVIKEIEEKLYGYYVRVNGQMVDVIVVKSSSGKYLRTDPDKTTKNNLDELPDCN